MQIVFAMIMSFWVLQEDTGFENDEGDLCYFNVEIKEKRNKKKMWRLEEEIFDDAIKEESSLMLPFGHGFFHYFAGFCKDLELRLKILPSPDFHIKPISAEEYWEKLFKYTNYGDFLVIE